MEALLDKFIDVLLARLESDDCSAQDMSNIRQFLKDNGYQIDPIKSKDALDDLMANLENKAGFPELPELPASASHREN
jgi:hypothetical protein